MVGADVLLDVVVVVVIVAETVHVVMNVWGTLWEGVKT